nr:hypothetical protein [uncultured Acetatifactor sp.]
MNHIIVGLEMMGMGMLGIFTAMSIIMIMTFILGKIDSSSASKKSADKASE